MRSNFCLGIVVLVTTGQHVLPKYTRGLWQLIIPHPAVPPKACHLSAGFLWIPALNLRTWCQWTMIKLDEGHASTLICTKGQSLLEIWRTLNMEGGRGGQAELAGCEWGHISTIFISPNQNSLLSVFIGIIYDVISLLLLSQRSAVGLKQNYYSYTTAYVCTYVW